VKQLLQPTDLGGWLGDIGILILRVFAGLSLALAHGAGKLPPAAGFVQYLGTLGVPVPPASAWAAALAEFCGGLLLAAGLLTRPAAIPVMFTMGVAAFVAHGGDPFAKRELALFFGVAALTIFLTGPGMLSLDRLLFGRKRTITV